MSCRVLLSCPRRETDGRTIYLFFLVAVAVSLVGVRETQRLLDRQAGDVCLAFAVCAIIDWTLVKAKRQMMSLFSHMISKHTK